MRFLAGVAFCTALWAASETDLQLAQNLNNQGAQAYYAGRLAEAESLYRQALAAWGAESREERRRTENNLAMLYRAQGRHGEAQRLLSEVVRGLEGEGREMVRALANLAASYREGGDLERARTTAERAVRIGERRLAADDAALGDAVHELATVCRAAGRMEDAAALYQRAAKIFPSNDPRAAAALNNLGEIALAERRYKDAETLLRRALAVWGESATGRERAKSALARINLAQALRYQGRIEEAGPLYREGIAALETTSGTHPADLAMCLANQADYYRDRGEPPKAVGLYQRALGMAREALGDGHADVALLMTRLAEVRRAQRRYAESVKLYRSSLPILEGALGGRDSRVRAAAEAYRLTLREARFFIVAAPSASQADPFE